MASSRPTLFRRLLTFPKPTATPAAATRNPAPAPPSRTPTPSFPSLLQKLVPRLPRPSSSSSSPSPDALPRRFFHQNHPALPTEIPLSLGLFAGTGGSGSTLADQLRDLNPPRVHLDGVSPPKGTEAASATLQASAEDVRKVLLASRMEAARERLRTVAEKSSSVPYAEFLRICLAAAGPEHGARVAKELDASGAVIVLSDVVFLRPDLVARAIESVIPRAASGTQTSTGEKLRGQQVTPSTLSPMESSELRDLEFRASQIDARAERGARAELRWGLALLAAQTLGFARLTFWELSWDVMEPICFYVTSIYFMAGYAFFLRTDRDPSFEVFFRARADARRKRIMAAEGFDAARLQELRARAGGRLSSGECSCYHPHPYHRAMHGSSESEAGCSSSSTLLARC